MWYFFICSKVTHNQVFRHYFWWVYMTYSSNDLEVGNYVSIEYLSLFLLLSVIHVYMAFKTFSVRHSLRCAYNNPFDYISN